MHIRPFSSINFNLGYFAPFPFIFALFHFSYSDFYIWHHNSWFLTDVAAVVQNVNTIYIKPLKNMCISIFPSYFNWGWSHVLSPLFFSLKQLNYHIFQKFKLMGLYLFYVYSLTLPFICRPISFLLFSKFLHVFSFELKTYGMFGFDILNYHFSQHVKIMWCSSSFFCNFL